MHDDNCNQSPIPAHAGNIVIIDAADLPSPNEMPAAAADPSVITHHPHILSHHRSTSSTSSEMMISSPAGSHHSRLESTSSESPDLSQNDQSRSTSQEPDNRHVEIHLVAETSGHGTDSDSGSNKPSGSGKNQFILS